MTKKADASMVEEMLIFIEAQDGEGLDEWYATQRDFAATILSDFCKHIGVEIVVPDYIPQLRKPEIDRNALFKAMMPDITRLFNIEYNKAKDET